MGRETIIYIAGPLTEAEPFEREMNRQIASDCGSLAVGLGLTPIIPHTMFAGLEGKYPDGEILHHCCHILRRCDILLLSHGWEESRGCLVELGEWTSIQPERPVITACMGVFFRVRTGAYPDVQHRSPRISIQSAMLTAKSIAEMESQR